MIVDAAIDLLATHDPWLVTFDQVARASGVSRALVHTYLGDRRGLIDAVQVRVVGRLDAWVGHGLGRASTPPGALRAIVHGTFAFVDDDREAWSVLGTTGGLDHPAMHAVRGRWARHLVAGTGATVGGEPVGGDPVGPAAAMAGLVLGVGTWVARGVDPDEVIEQLLRLIGSSGPPDAPPLGPPFPA